GNSLSGLWAGDAGYLWAVGAGGTILGYDGTVWFQAPSGVTADLAAVSGSGPNDVWAVGRGGVVLHFDGSGWTSHDNNGLSSDLLGVFAAAPNAVWVAGAPELPGLPPVLRK